MSESPEARAQTLLATFQEGGRGRPLGDLRKALAAVFASQGIEEAEIEAQRLLEAHVTPHGLYPGLGSTDPLPAAAGPALAADIARRLNREPLAYILGRQAFWTLALKVTPDALIPRTDSETVVEAALEGIGLDRDGRPRNGGASRKHAPLRCLDIATGSGAILLALLIELPEALGVGTDISAAALAIAQTNLVDNALAGRAGFVQTRWADGLAGPFDVIVANPPYIASPVIETLAPEVRDFEPRAALDGGPDGMAAYPALLAQARRLLKPSGVACFEIGYDQGARARRLAAAAGFPAAEILQDLAGRDRVLRLVAPQASPPRRS